GRAVQDLFDHGRLPDTGLAGHEEKRGRAGLLGMEVLLDLGDFPVPPHELPAEDLADTVLDAEAFHELVRAGLAKTRLALEGAHHDALQVRGDLRAVRCGGRNPALELPRDDLAHRLAEEWMDAGQRLVRHDADGVEVAARVGGGALPDLGRGVAGSSRGAVPVTLAAPHSGVGDLHDTPGAEE